jgi:hypothetical protein
MELFGCDKSLGFKSSGCLLWYVDRDEHNIWIDCVH